MDLMEHSRSRTSGAMPWALPDESTMVAFATDFGFGRHISVRQDRKSTPKNAHQVSNFFQHEEDDGCWGSVQGNGS